MQMLGSTDMPIVLQPEDRVKNILVRLVLDLPYGFVLGARVLRVKRSVISLEKGKGLQPSPGAPWVPFKSRSTGGRRSKETYCAVRPPDITRPSLPGVEPEIPELPVCSQGKAAWENDGTLQWELLLVDNAEVAVVVGKAVEAYVHCP